MLEEKLDIKNMIYEIRGKQVMLDSDLARLYQCKNGTKEINQAVKNNIEKFPDRYSWKLTKEDVNDLRSKFLTTKINNMSRSLPRVFTEQGVAMLATILKSKIAVQVSINIMDTFVEMRKYISSNLIEQKFINEIVLKDSKRIDILEETFNGFKEKNNHIFFEGQIYDAYSLMLDIFNKSEKEIIIIDNYIDKIILDILCKTHKNILIVTNKYNNEDYLKYKSEYSNVKIIINNNFHDRFIIIDREILYHCGASFKDLGNKCFAINKLEDNESINNVINRINI